MKRPLTKNSAVLFGVLLLSACTLRQPPLATESYSFDLPSPRPGAVSERTVAVLPFSAAADASGQMLLYRSGEVTYESDFYNRWLAPPAQMLTGELRRWLARAKVGQVLEPGTPLSAELLVQPRLSELYADYRHAARPQAVTAMVMTVVIREPSGNRVLFERVYRAAVPMPEVAPAAAVKAWSAGVAQIFDEFTGDLRAAR